jgi:hypothetical protein
MRRAAKVDATQAEIVAALKKAGATVQHLHSVGEGCPDLLVGWRGTNWLFECKPKIGSPSDRKLRPNQVEWHDGWKGQVATVETPEAAMSIMQGISTRGIVR